MRRFLVPALALAALMPALLLAGCAGRDGFSHVTTAPLLQACAQYCQQGDEGDVVARNGCMRGCEAANLRFPLRGRHYLSRQSCALAVRRLDVEAQLRDMDAHCEGLWAAGPSRKGCEGAGPAFYGAVNEFLCRADAR